MRTATRSAKLIHSDWALYLLIVDLKKKKHHNVIHIECRLLEVQELFSQNRSFRVHIVWITLPHLALILWQRSSAGQATSWIESIIFLMKLCCYCQLHTVYSDGMAMQCHWKDEWNCNNITVLSTPKLSTFRSMIVLKVFIHCNVIMHVISNPFTGSSSWEVRK